MIVRLLGIMIAFLPFATEAGVWDSVKNFFAGSRNYAAAPAIDVLIVNDQPGAMLEIHGKYRIFDPNTGKHLGTRLVGKRKMIQSIATGLRWGEEFPGIYQLQVIPEDQNSKIFVNGIEYKGSLYVYDIGGSISIVNKVKIEDYLRSTLSEQFYEPLPEETLSAIAIVSRTHALYQSEHKKNLYWAVDATQVGYEGENSVDETSHIMQAIESTYNMVLSATGAYEGAVTPIAAQWGSGTGGRFSHQSATFSHISLFEAEEMAQNGGDAAQILNRAFPAAHIELLR